MQIRPTGLPASAKASASASREPKTPQVAILGMHKIEPRPVAVDGQVVIRPMMYVALSYDHRIVDGQGAVTFLVKVKEAIEDPQRLLLDV